MLIQRWAISWIGTGLRKWRFSRPWRCVDTMSGLVCAVYIVLSANIVTGIMLGFSTLVIGRIVAGEWRKLNVGTVAIAVVLAVFYLGGWAI